MGHYDEDITPEFETENDYDLGDTRADDWYDSTVMDGCDAAERAGLVINSEDYKQFVREFVSAAASGRSNARSLGMIR